LTTSDQLSLLFFLKITKYLPVEEENPLAADFEEEAIADEVGRTMEIIELGRAAEAAFAECRSLAVLCIAV
jgi:hypothetical protein